MSEHRDADPDDPNEGARHDPDPDPRDEPFRDPRDDLDAEPPAAEPDDVADVPAPTPLTQQLGRVTVVVLAALFGIFAVVNAQPVDFSWVFGGTDVVTGPDGERTSGGVPLIVLLVVSFALGAAVGALLARRTRRRHRDGR